MQIELKRGYSIEVEMDKISVGGQVTILGNYSKSGYMATCIVSKYGIAPTVRENHGQVTGIVVEVKNERTIF